MTKLHVCDKMRGVVSTLSLSMVVCCANAINSSFLEYSFTARDFVAAQCMGQKKLKEYFEFWTDVDNLDCWWPLDNLDDEAYEKGLQKYFGVAAHADFEIKNGVYFEGVAENIVKPTLVTNHDGLPKLQYCYDDDPGPPRRAVRLHLRKRAPGENFVPSRKPEWDLQYDGAGVWRESIVKVWWDRLMKHDAPIPLSSLPDRQHQRAAEMQENWRQANEQFKRDVLDIRPVDLSPLLVESAQETERARVKADLAASGVAPGCAEWEEALAQVLLPSLRMYGRPSIAQGGLGRVTVCGFCLSHSLPLSVCQSVCLSVCGYVEIGELAAG